MVVLSQVGVTVCFLEIGQLLVKVLKSAKFVYSDTTFLLSSGVQLTVLTGTQGGLSLLYVSDLPPVNVAVLIPVEITDHKLSGPLPNPAHTSLFITWV